MKTKPLLITNNDKAHAYCENKMECIFLSEGAYLDVLYAARDYIHQGHKLLSHPMAGSLKPNQTPYKTVILESEAAGNEEVLESVILIENSIEAAQKFLNNRSLPKWPDKIRNDFKTVDLSFISGFADRISVTE